MANEIDASPRANVRGVPEVVKAEMIDASPSRTDRTDVHTMERRKRYSFIFCPLSLGIQHREEDRGGSSCVCELDMLVLSTGR